MIFGNVAGRQGHQRSQGCRQSQVCSEENAETALYKHIGHTAEPWRSQGQGCQIGVPSRGTASGSAWKTKWVLTITLDKKRELCIFPFEI
jgi:hypothetical protein